MSITVAGGLKRSGAVLLVSCYELGHQPQAVALPLAFLERAGYAPAALDLAVQSLDMQKIREARFVGISVPMHTALRLGVKVARRIREVNPGCHVCFYGNYALLHAESLLHRLADSILGGEFEARLVELVDALGEGRCLEPGLPARLLPALERLDFPVPSRRALPGIEHYAHLDHGGRHRVAGHVEASRGCLHRCRHCPIPAVYAGRLFVVPRESVLEDVRNQVRSGAAHITFGDADFLNGPSHSLRVVRAMHEEFPDLSFDFTAKVEHVLAHRRLMPELGRLGAVFMVTAVESLSDRVLSILDKRHTRADVFDARAILRDAGIAMRPSLLPFTPWSTFDDFVEILDFVESEDLVDHVDPVQYTIRLLVPPGSLLLEHLEMQPHLGPLDEEHLTHRWTHPDPRMDALQEQAARTVEDAAENAEDAYVTFHRIRLLTRSSGAAPRRRHPRPPRLTESWFC